MKINDSVCVVTGGLNGLGKATVDKLLEMKAIVIIFDIIKPTNYYKILSEKYKNRLDYVHTDITNEDNVILSVDYVINKYNKLNILINCAGIGYVEEIISNNTTHNTKKFIDVFNINCFGTFLCSKHAANHIKNSPLDSSNERGVIINVASIAGTEGTSGQVAYSASKGAIIGMSMPMARDLCKYNIRVSTISPGPIDTGIKMGEYSNKLKEMSLLKRFGYPSEFASLVIHIIDNQYLAGSIIRLDGGLIKPHIEL